MVQVLPQSGSLFGRIGAGIGQGLSEQLPKEMERGRLAQGLQQFEQDSAGLNPIQSLARLSAIPGITPQMIQSFGELAKIQNQGNAYARASGGQPNSEIGGSNSPSQNKTKNNPINPQGQNPTNITIENNQKTPNMDRKGDTPQVIPGNPLNEQNLPRTPWSPQERNAAISDYINKGFFPDQAKQLAADDESRYLAEPDVHQERQKTLDKAKGEVRDSLKRHLETKLQKTGENIFKDVEGPMILNAERGMIRDLILNPGKDVDNVANDWSERLYRTAIAKGKLRSLGQNTGWENFLKGNQSLKQLQEYQDIFKRSGNLEEFQNILKQKNTPAQFDSEGKIIKPETFGLGMSDQGSASVAYPPNNKIEKYISKVKPSATPAQSAQKARKVALEIEKDITADDSIASIARKLSDVDPYFDQQAFYDQISEDKDQIGLNERQRLELAEGIRNILPNWGDLLFLPIFRR